jgi:hypothetical protein
MVWFYERGQESLRLHTAYDNDSHEFVVRVTWSHGRTDETRFSNLRAFRDWIEAFERTLDHEQWKNDGGPIVLPDGWPDRRLL